MQGHEIGGDAASVAANRDGAQIAAGHLLERSRYPLLRRVIGLDVAGRVVATGHAGGKKACVFAGAVVAGGVERSAREDRPFCGVGRARRLDAAFESRRTEADAREPVRDGLDMRGLAFMRCAGKRQFLVGEAEPVSGPGFDQRDGLERLHSRARVDRHVRVARAVHDFPGCIDDHKRAAVAALHGRAPCHLDENRICAHVLKIVIPELHYPDVSANSVVMAALGGGHPEKQGLLSCDWMAGSCPAISGAKIRQCFHGFFC